MPLYLTGFPLISNIICCQLLKGTVLEVADDVKGFQPGMRVAGSVTTGAFAEEVIANTSVRLLPS